MWRKPPWCSMGSPGAFACVDLSNLPSDMGLGSHVGDLPNYFYGLRLPAPLWPFFCLEGVTVDEFVNFAKDRGITVEVGPDDKYLCVIVVLFVSIYHGAGS